MQGLRVSVLDTQGLRVSVGSLRKIVCDAIPIDFTNRLMGDYFDVESSELVFHGRYRISVNADSVKIVLGVPNENKLNMSLKLMP